MSGQNDACCRKLQGAAESEPAGGDLRKAMLAFLPDLRAFARFLVRDRVAADDLVQDTIVRALSNLPQFTPGTQLKAWLFTILRNLFYEQARRRRRETQALQCAFTEDTILRPVQTDAAELRDLGRLLWQLPPLAREALVLIGTQQLTHEEAARICGVPTGTMKARVSRARSQLTKLIALPPPA